jgi:hypothetical protein
MKKESGKKTIRVEISPTNYRLIMKWKSIGKIKSLQKFVSDAIFEKILKTQKKGDNIPF